MLSMDHIVPTGPKGSTGPAILASGWVGRMDGPDQGRTVESSSSFQTHDKQAKQFAQLQTGR